MNQQIRDTEDLPDRERPERGLTEHFVMGHPSVVAALAAKDAEIARLRQDIRNLEAALASKRFPA